MKRSFNTLVVFTIALLSSVLSRAEDSPAIYQESFTITPPFQNPAARVYLPQFDSWNGTRILDSITLSLQGTLSAGISIENLDPNVSFIAPIIFASFTVSPWNGSAKSAEVSYLGDFSEYAMGETKDLGLFINQFSFSNILTSDFDSYIGLGSLGFDIDALSNFSAAGASQARSMPYGYEAIGELSIAYNYHSTVPVPEPSSAILGTFAGMFFLTRRRRN